ncbi:hypothetical protein IKE13_02300 [Candidatus Saccharibacteria bacterium]|nr:hypothetical protein [Candidatus Saccharibacteria bacterium]
MWRSREGNYRWIYILIGMIFIMVAVVLIVLFFLQGNEKIVSKGDDVEAAESITCSNDDYFYPFFRYNNSREGSVKISVVFNDGKLDSVNLVARLYYDGAEIIEKSRVENHIAMNNNFYENSMDADSLGAHFSALDDSMQMTLYAKAKQLNGVNAKYFLIDSAGGYTKEMLVDNYNKQGLNCVIREN